MAQTTVTEPRVAEEIQKMEQEAEPLLPVEMKLIWWTFGTGVVLLAILVMISRAYA
jgi:hypothetical protein